MLTGQNIICFGSSSWQYPGLQQTTMRLLADKNRILYVNALGSRNVSLKLSQCRFYFNRIKRQFQKNPVTTDGTVVCNPFVIPFVYNPLATRCNRALLRAQFHRLLPKINFRDYILWVGTPSAAPFLDLFNPALTIYNPVDRYRAFSFVNGEKIRAYEKLIGARADAVICTSDAIRNDMAEFNRHAFAVTHGVDVDHFHSALSREYRLEDLEKLPKPIIGFFGGLSERVNYHLLGRIARRYPDASLVLIGKQLHSLAELEGLKNVHLLGYRDFDLLPQYMKHFSVCLIPYHVNELMEAVDPIKLREYLCQGKPVVSVDLPEVRKLAELVYIGRDEEEFVAMVGRALEEKDPALVEERIKTARRSEWSVKIAEISAIVNDAFMRKNRVQ
ncbi:MAG: glycosyltransferase [Proteobacteria bacterium]|nr:glycosyltransferase [Pseudomonadota bacterium]